MKNQRISNGVVHVVPKDIKNMILLSPKGRDMWEDITPLARNEWICWVESAKKSETRDRRIKIMLDKFASGKRRPCCWAGCNHR